MSGNEHSVIHSEPMVKYRGASALGDQHPSSLLGVNYRPGGREQVFPEPFRKVIAHILADTWAICQSEGTQNVPFCENLQSRDCLQAEYLK